ncbi:MAG: hypothetical protein RSB71_00330 [Bacilli bacterium]
MLFIVIGIILFFVVIYNKIVEPSQFIKEAQPLFNFLVEEDYDFLLHLKYGNDVDVSKMFGIRVRNGLIVIVIMLFLFLADLKFIYVLVAIIAGFVVFKQPYSNLKSYYKRNLHHINLMLPYYLKSLEILVQHYTVPVALSRSIESSPEVFKPGLQALISKIEAGNSTVDPYMEFARAYPVRDSMRMMRLLYRLSLGSQDKKQEQLMMFSKTVSALQNKSRDQKYAERLDKMEKKTMVMLFTTGGGIMVLMLLSMMMMMNY